MISALVEAGLPQEEIVDEIVGVYLADSIFVRSYLYILPLLIGHESTSTTLTLLFYLLALHPEYAKKVQQEVDSVMGSRKLPAYDDLSKFKYLRCCINETLRLYPNSNSN